MSKTEGEELDLEFLLKRIEQLFRNSDNEQVVALSDTLIAQFATNRDTPIHSTYLARFYNFRARAQHLLGHAEEALRDIDSAVVLAAQEPLHMLLRGTWRLEAGSYDCAIADFTAAMRAEEQLHSSYYANTTLCLRALAHIMLGQFDEAGVDVQGIAPDTRFFVMRRVWTAADLARCVAAKRRP